MGHYDECREGGGIDLAYKTKDGVFHETLEAAKDHNKALEFIQWARAYEFSEKEIKGILENWEVRRKE